MKLRKDDGKLSNKNKLLDSLSGELKKQFSEAAGTLKSKFSLNSATSFLLDQANEAAEELKEINSVFYTLAQTTDLTEKQLEEIENSSFQIASKYGARAADYISEVQKMSTAGVRNAEQFAQLSLLAQNAGNLESDLAKNYLMASDAAYGYAGSAEKLTALLDSQNQVAAKNSIAFNELAAAAQTAASHSASAAISESEMTALLGTGIVSTGESGESVGNALNGILMTLNRTTGETGADGQLIDEDALSAAEERCNSLGIAMTVMRDGIERLRDPISILKELSVAYNALPDNSEAKAGILSDIGGEYGSDVLSGILSNWDAYEQMIKDYQNADGFSMKAIPQPEDTWESALNGLSNTWTKTVGNIADSDLIISAINGLNSVLDVVNDLTASLGPLPTLLMGTGLVSGLKNVGSPKMSGLHFV